MSQLQTNINLPSVDSIDGFATTSSVVSIITSMEDELDNFGNAIGNIYNDGDYNNNTPKMINSVGESIGSELIDPAMPFGKTFSNFTESKVLSGSKTAILKLNANTSNSITVQGYNSSNAPTITYNLATNPYSMLPNECYINGRYIVFKDPPYQFSITYDGTYADSLYLEKDGYMPNIIPNLYNPSYSRPTLTIESGKIKVSINNANAIKSESTIDDQYTITLANYLAPFVDPTGNTPCPKAYISAFIYRASTSKFSKLECNNIYVLSPKSYYLDTDESVDLANDLILISIANTTIKEWLLVAIRELENHKHDGMDISSPIRHETLDGLLPSSDNPDIKYAKSIIPNNEHVQYLHREGYTPGDSGAYNNALLGDLLLASINPASLFNNVLSDSNILYFGSTADGHSFKRRAVDKDLLLFSSQNGLSIQYNNSVSSNFGLSILDSKIRSTASALHIEAANGRTVFNNVAGNLQDIEAGVVYAQNVQAAEAVTIANNGDLNIGNISMVHSGTNLTIDGTNSSDKLIFDIDIQGAKAEIVDLDITNINLGNGDKISFIPNIVGQENIYLTSMLNIGAAFNSSKPLYFTGYGKNSGLAFAKKDVSEIYGNIYVASETGLQPTSSDHNTYFESGNADVYFLKDTLTPKAISGVTYEWNGVGAETSSYKPIDSLSNWPKADVHANTINGNKFKFSQYNAISYTGAIQGLNSNKTIINSDNGVLFTRDQSNIYTNAVLNKCDIEVKDVYANNVITSVITSDTSNIANITIPFGGSFTSLGNANFSAPVTINNTLTVGSTLYTSSITNTGNLTTNSMQVAGNISASTLSILNDVAFAGISSVNATFSSVYVGDKIEFSETGKEIRMNNGAITGLQMPSISSPTDVANKGYVDAAIASVGGASSGALATETAARIAADNTKADKNGSSAEVFEVGTAVSANQAVRKEQLDAAISAVSTDAATNAQMLDGTLNTVFATPLVLKDQFAVLRSQEGYIKLPSWMGGIIFMWGKHDGSSANGSIAFTAPSVITAIYSVQATPIYNSNAGNADAAIVQIKSYNTGGFNFATAVEAETDDVFHATSLQFTWFAIGVSATW